MNLHEFILLSIMFWPLWLAPAFIAGFKKKLKKDGKI